MGDSPQQHPSVRSRLRPLGDPLVLFAGFFDASPVAILIVHADATAVLSNQAYRTLFGTDPPSGVSLFEAELGFAADERDAHLAALRRAIAGEPGTDSPLWHLPGGVAVVCSFLPLRDARGAVSHVAITYSDVTAELQLQAERDRLGALHEYAADLTVMQDAAGRVLWVSPSVERVLGHAVSSFVGSQVGDHLHGDDRARCLDQYAEVVADPSRRSATTLYRLRHADGSWRWFEGAALNLLGHPAVCAIVVNQHDVTARVESEDARKSLERQLAQAMRLEAIGRLAGGIAHDFNNLLSVVLTFTELACEDDRLPQVVRGDLEQVRRAGERAAELTQQLLAFSRRQMLQPRPTSLVGAVGDMERMLHRLIGEHIQLTARHAPDVALVRVDPTQLEQVILNLVLNARDAMPAGGKVTIETTNVELDEEYAAAHVGVLAGLYVQLSVTDTGIGMDRETQAHVFEPFFTTKAIGQGTGLGLATVYGVVKQSGGNIWVYSEPGLGTTFKVYLPRSDEEPATLGADQPARLNGRGEIVLVVEDDDQVRGVAERILIGRGYTVLVADGASQAEGIALAHSGRIDLLLTDVVMPRVSGRELAEALCARRPELKVLYMSGYTEDAIVRHGVLDQALHFVQKPLTPDALLRKVREVLDGPE